MHRDRIRRPRRVSGGVASGFALVLFSALFVAAIPGSGAGDDVAARREAAARGRVTYRVYCRNCHGDHSHGDGKLAAVISTPPADLTGLARRNGGAFPEDRVFRIIDGREEVAAHGRREMPVWGDAFRPAASEGGSEEEEAAIRAKIEDLVDYLASIQK